MSYDLDFRPDSYWPTDDDASDPAVVASIELQSTLSDVIWVRAEPAGDEIRYCIEDEYETAWQIFIETSHEPLTMRELVELIDTADAADREPHNPGLIEPVLEMNAVDGEVDPSDLIGFVRVRSEFYPELEAYYRDRVQRWAAERS